MRRLISAALAVLMLSFAAPALAANSTVPAMTGVGSVNGTDLFYCVPGAADRKCTAAQIAAYVNSLFSGDATAAAGGAVTFATVNANVGTFGSATQCTTVTVNAKGLITAASQTACTPAMSSVTGRATLAQLPQGIANSIWINPTGSTADMQNVAIPACANDGSHALVYVNASGLACATITGGGGGAVSSVAGGIGVTVTPTTGAVVVSFPVTVRNNTATTDTITSADKGTLVTESNASPVAVAITTAGFVSTDYFTVKNKGAGLATYTPSSGSIDGNATLTVKQNQSADLYFDGTNYWTLPGRPTNAACSDLSNGTVLCSTTPGTGVATAAAANLSAAGGLTSTIASGAQALGTTAVASAACSAAITASAPNTATTDVVLASFNADPTAVTGYIPATAGMLTIIAYPTSGNVNFKYCNNTSSSITPGAITLNWRVVR